MTGEGKDEFDDFGAETYGVGVPVIVGGFSNAFAVEIEEAAGSHFGSIENYIGELKVKFSWMIDFYRLMRFKSDGPFERTKVSLSCLSTFFFGL